MPSSGMTPRRFSEKRRFGGMYSLHQQGGKNWRDRNSISSDELVIANAVASSLIRFTLLMEAPRSSETSFLTRATRRHIPKDGILHLSTHLNGTKTASR
jgi:hypothetical protein